MSCISMIGLLRLKKCAHPACELHQLQWKLNWSAGLKEKLFANRVTEYSCVRINSDETAGTFPLQNIIMDRERMKERGRLLRGDFKGLW